MVLNLFHDDPVSDSYYSVFIREDVLRRLRSLDALARAKGPGALDPRKDKLVRIGAEFSPDNRVTKNCYGVFSLAWQAQRHPEWPDVIQAELDEIRQRVKQAHGTQIRFLIWAGMGGSAEDKSLYNEAKLLRRGPRCYVLDSTDPAKLKGILEDMTRRSRLALPEALRATLVAGMAMGMTSYEPAVNLDKLAALYERHGIDSRPNFICMTLPGSVLDRFAAARGYRRVELQPDGANSTAGRHSAPLTRGSLYALGLCRADLRAWVQGTALTDEQVRTAFRLSAFLHCQGLEGRDKITLLLPKAWAGAGGWTKQNFEESLGKSEQLGIKIILEDRIKLANYRSPKEPGQDRAFLAIRVKGMPSETPDKAGLLRRSGYPVASLALPRGAELSTYMQFIHYVVFGLAYLRDMNFVTQPGVELYKSIAGGLFEESGRAGGVENCAAWKEMTASPRQACHRGCVTLYYNHLAIDPPPEPMDAPSTYAYLVKRLLAGGAVEYAELTYFGDTRYSAPGRNILRVLNRSAERLYRSRLKMPADICEGPAMNHAYHEMIIGHGRCFSTVIMPAESGQLPEAGYTANCHRAQYLATQLALAGRGRHVAGMLIKNTDEESVSALEDFFRQAGTALRGIRV
mgnify:CR=1 FL=1